MNSPFAAGQTARNRRPVAAFLLVGWLAFWLTSVIAPCCNSFIAKANAGQDTAALQTLPQGPAGSDHREMPCAAFFDAQPMPSYSAAVSMDSTPRVPPYVASSTLPPVPRAVESAQHPITALLPPVPFHLRTARLLI